MDLKSFGNPFMFCDIFPIVRCVRTGSNRQRLQELDDSICHGLSGLALNPSRERQARLPLGQGDNRMTMSVSDNRIHFPISQALADIHNCWPPVDAHPVFELATPIVTAVALPALLPA